MDRYILLSIFKRFKKSVRNLKKCFEKIRILYCNSVSVVTQFTKTSKLIPSMQLLTPTTKNFTLN